MPTALMVTIKTWLCSHLTKTPQTWAMEVRKPVMVMLTRVMTAAPRSKLSASDENANLETLLTVLHGSQFASDASSSPLLDSGISSRVFSRGITTTFAQDATSPSDTRSPSTAKDSAPSCWESPPHHSSGGNTFFVGVPDWFSYLEHN